VARRDRARFELAAPAAGDRLILARSPELPPTVEWAVVGVTAWR
jgi:hypothetical protein